MDCFPTAPRAGFPGCIHKQPGPWRRAILTGDLFIFNLTRWKGENVNVSPHDLHGQIDAGIISHPKLVTFSNDGAEAPLLHTESIPADRKLRDHVSPVGPARGPSCKSGQCLCDSNCSSGNSGEKLGSRRPSQRERSDLRTGWSKQSRRAENRERIGRRLWHSTAVVWRPERKSGMLRPVELLGDGSESAQIQSAAFPARSTATNARREPSGALAKLSGRKDVSAGERNAERSTPAGSGASRSRQSAKRRPAASSRTVVRHASLSRKATTLGRGVGGGSGATVTGSVLARGLLTGAMKRRPRLEIVSMKRGLSAESPRASRSLLVYRCSRVYSAVIACENFTGTVDQEARHLERLVLKFHANSLLPQFPVCRSASNTPKRITDRLRLCRDITSGYSSFGFAETAAEAQRNRK
jgi:hypothetical protein